MSVSIAKPSRPPINGEPAAHTIARLMGDGCERTVADVVAETGIIDATARDALNKLESLKILGKDRVLGRTKIPGRKIIAYIALPSDPETRATPVKKMSKIDEMKAMAIKDGQAPITYPGKVKAKPRGPSVTVADIRNAFRENQPVHGSEIMAITGCTGNRFYYVLQGLIDSGVVERVPGRRYPRYAMVAAQ